MNRIILSIILVAVGFFGVFVTSDYLEANRAPLPESYSDSDLSLQGERLKGYALGTEGLLADWYWMRSLQYIGDKLLGTKQKSINLENLRPLNPRLLYPLLDTSTSLDPRFIAAYSFGAVVLPAIDNDQAVKIVEKGIRNNPGNWRLYQHLGYIHWRAKDFQTAAKTYSKGAEIAGAPPFMKSMAAKMLSEGGKRETARAIYEQMYSDAADARTRESARLRLLSLDALDQLDFVNNLIAQSGQTGGSCSIELSDIVRLLSRNEDAKQLKFAVNANGQLVDPSGVPYALDPKTCSLGIDVANSKIPAS